MLAPGTNIGQRYTIDGLLGTGGMSNLYLARDAKANGMIRVIKEMTARYADPNEQKMAEDLFMREAQLLSTLNHPNIPKVFDRFKFQGLFYLNMEYVQGEDLGKIITQAGKPLEEKDVAVWGHQMSMVLYYLHRQNPPIVFRDVKPSNIMISGDQVKLIDFGIARLFTPAKKGDTMRIGSPGYAPPEQYSGQTDPRSDIYALGVTLHHALTGHDPTVSQTPFLIPPAKTLNPRISDEMANIIVKATQLDPDKRYPSMIEMKRDLQVVLRKHGINVGGSVPLSPLSGQALSAAPVAAAAVKPTPVLVGAGAQAAATPAPPPAFAPPVPGLSGYQNALNNIPPPHKARRPWAPMLFLAAGLGGTVYFWHANLSLVGTLRGMYESVMSSNTLPTDPSQAAALLYKKGGPLPVVLEYSQQALEEHPGEPEQLLVYQNALALASELPVTRWAVAVPKNAAQPDLLRGLALAQKVLNDRGGVDQSLLVLEVVAYENDGFAATYRDALEGNLGRTGAPALQGVLVFAEQAFPWTELLAGSTMPTYLVGPLTGAVPSGLHALTIGERPLAEIFKSAFSLDPPKILWTAQKTPHLEGTVTAAVDAKLLATVKEKAAKLIVIDADQAKEVALLKLPPDVKVVMLADRWELLPNVSDLGGLKASALVPGSRFSASEFQSAFFRVGSLTFGDWKAAPRSPGGTGYDGLLWAAQQGGGKWSGASVKLDAQGKQGSSPWNLLEVRNEQWMFSRNVE